MEENIAILMADLSGYTALTETHGSATAANLIDKYIEIVETCLVGDSQVKERTGDELMIVSTSADHLLATATRIMKNTSAEENFLQVHGGLHYGKVLKRNDSYYGSAINLTARIAAKADPGTFLCSGDFMNTLTERSGPGFQSKGKHRFKNVTQEIEIAEMLNTGASPVVIDPICRMQIQDKSMAISHPEKDHLHFCSKECLAIFDKTQAPHN